MVGDHGVIGEKLLLFGFLSRCFFSRTQLLDEGSSRPSVDRTSKVL